MHACFPAVAVLSIVSYRCKSFYFYSMPFSFVVQEKCYQHWHVIENIVSMHLQAAQGVHGHATGDGFFTECPRLCRVFFIGHSVKRLFAKCQRKSTRQTTGTRQKSGLPSAEHSAKNNTRQRAAAVNGRQPPLTLCRVSSPDTRQRGSFAECHFLTLDKPYIFFTFDLQTFSAVLIQYLVLHVPMWHISRTFFYISLIYFI